MSYFVLAAERKKSNGLTYLVYFVTRSANEIGTVQNTTSIDWAKRFTSEISARYAIQNGGDPMKCQNYKITPVNDPNE